MFLRSINDTFSLLSLPSSGTFEFYLRDSCVNSNWSDWSGPWYFSTDCGVLAAPAYIPFYDQPSALYCWSLYGTAPHSLWEKAVSYVFSQSADYLTDHSNLPQKTFMMKAKLGSNPEFKVLEMPPVDVSALSQGVYVLLLEVNGKIYQYKLMKL